MAKSWKNLFIKEDEPENEGTTKQVVNEPQVTFTAIPKADISPTQHAPVVSSVDNTILQEVMAVYEKGLENINMPGYDFLEFFNAVKAVGSGGEQVYQMAFKMAQTMDNTLSAEKLIRDADYYISNIKEVHQQNASKGQQKLDSLLNSQKTDRDKLSSEITSVTDEIENLKRKIQTLEKKLSDCKAELDKVGEQYRPQQVAVEQKLFANDKAMQISIEKLNTVKEGIVRYIKK